MLIRKVTIIFVIGIAVGLVSFYFFRSLPPLDLVKVQELIVEKKIGIDNQEGLYNEIQNLVSTGEIIGYFSPNIFIGFGMLMLSIAFVFVSMHLAVDKLFFRKYYETPSISSAMRRSIIFCICIASMVYMKLNLLDNLTLLAIPVVYLLIEIIITRILSGRSQGTESGNTIGNEKISTT